MHNQEWSIPSALDLMFPNLKKLVKQVILPRLSKPDELIWKHNTSGELSMKDAYEFKRSTFPQLTWAKTIWCNEIPPSKSLLVWRLMLQTDDKLKERGYNLPSM
ncbi:ribonuclease H [Trifolium pratense]|uniref:Ribonuclease H n=1 Tax=Trifolium pratense TaxID=57577 RepID=A0A2K3KRX9_TRIPR|nr:ribonuclease H [Trifolium pratense]